MCGPCARPRASHLTTAGTEPHIHYFFTVNRASSSVRNQLHCFLLLRMMDEHVVEQQTADFSAFLPEHRRLTRLYCMNGGYHLQLLPDGTVRGQRDDGDAHTFLKLKAVDIGVVVIFGEEAGMYLAMNSEGRLYSSPTVNEECYFLEKLEENHYNTYQSKKYREMNWYVGLKKNGKPKLGPRTHIGQKAIFFLPRQVHDSEK